MAATAGSLEKPHLMTALGNMENREGFLSNSTCLLVLAMVTSEGSSGRSLAIAWHVLT